MPPFFGQPHVFRAQFLGAAEPHRYVRKGGIMKRELQLALRCTDSELYCALTFRWCWNFLH